MPVVYDPKDTPQQHRFAGSDSEFYELVKSWTQANRYLVQNERTLEEVQAVVEECRKHTQEIEKRLWSVLNGSYPRVIRFGTEGLAIMYSINPDTAQVETKQVVVIEEE